MYVLSLTVWQSSQVISGSLALLARGRRLPHVVQKRRPLKAMLGRNAVVLEGRGFVGSFGYMYSSDTRQQQQHCSACICAQTLVHHLSHLTLANGMSCKPIGIEYVRGISSCEFDSYVP